MFFCLPGKKSGTCLLHHFDVGLLGGYLDMMAKLGPLARRDFCVGVMGLLEKLMTHLFLLSATMCAATVVDVVAGVVGAVVMVLALLASLMFCTFVLLWGCPPKRVCLPKEPKVLKLCFYPLLFLSKYLNLLICFPLILFCLCSFTLLIRQTCTWRHPGLGLGSSVWHNTQLCCFHTCVKYCLYT